MLKTITAIFISLIVITPSVFASRIHSGIECPPPELISAASGALNKFSKDRIWGQIYEYTVSSDMPAFIYNSQQWNISVSGIATENDSHALSIAKARALRAARISESHYGCAYLDNIDNDLAVTANPV